MITAGHYVIEIEKTNGKTRTYKNPIKVEKSYKSELDIALNVKDGYLFRDLGSYVGEFFIPESYKGWNDHLRKVTKSPWWKGYHNNSILSAIVRMNNYLDDDKSLTINVTGQTCKNLFIRDVTIEKISDWISCMKGKEVYLYKRTKDGNFNKCAILRFKEAHIDIPKITAIFI